jgi:hypothetical protein
MCRGAAAPFNQVVQGANERGASEQTIGQLVGWVRALKAVLVRRPKRLPVVLAPEEVGAVLGEVTANEETFLLMVGVLYRSGRRPMECTKGEGTRLSGGGVRGADNWTTRAFGIHKLNGQRWLRQRPVLARGGANVASWTAGFGHFGSRQTPWF